MSIIQVTTDFAGQTGVLPRLVRLLSSDDYDTVTAEGYLNSLAGMGIQLLPSDFIFASYSDGFGMFNPSFSANNITLVPTISTGNIDGPLVVHGNVQAGDDAEAGFFVSYPAVANTGFLVFQAVANSGDYIITVSNASMGQAATFSIPDPGASTADFIISAKPAGQSVASSTASATPGTIRALKGLMTGSNATMSSGNLVGVRGEVDCVGASGGFLYGVQGKVIPTGTLSGSSWTAGVFGQLDISAGTINAGQTACIWGDYGATSGTITSATGMRMFAGTNTTAATLNSMIYLYGKTSNLLELAANGSSYISTGGATASGTIKKIAILIEGVQYYLQAATVYS